MIVYVVSTWWPNWDGRGEPPAEEDGPDDLEKIGESVDMGTLKKRMKKLKSASPLRLMPRYCWDMTEMGFHGIGDAGLQGYLEYELNQPPEVEKASELGLPNPYEWFRGGASQFFASIFPKTYYMNEMGEIVDTYYPERFRQVLANDLLSDIEKGQLIRREIRLVDIYGN